MLSREGALFVDVNRVACDLIESLLRSCLFRPWGVARVVFVECGSKGYDPFVKRFGLLLGLDVLEFARKLPAFVVPTS